MGNNYCPSIEINKKEVRAHAGQIIIGSKSDTGYHTKDKKMQDYA